MSRSRKASRSRSGRGSVLLISALLIGSAGIRISTGAGAAVAQGELASELLLPKNMTPQSGVVPKPDRGQTQTLLEALKTREERVSERESNVAMRTKALDVAQREVERRLELLQQAEDRLSNTLALAETAAEDDLTRLTTVYENMKPKEAAKLFEAMEPEFAAGFIGRMRPDVAAKVMSGLDPQSAYSISAILAGRNARAPKS
jgi:flagellar motility protein MotE (MotC chaperone)